MNILAWEEVSTTYLFVFLGVVAGLIGVFYLGAFLLSWRARRRMEREVKEVENRCGLSDEEADFVVHVANKNQLNVPTTLYTSLQVFDTLVGREIELLIDSVAPSALKQTTTALAYGARAKLFPGAMRMPAALASPGTVVGQTGQAQRGEG